MAHPKKKEHDLNRSDESRALLEKFALHLRAWMKREELDMFQVGRRVKCSGYQIRHLLRLENYPSTPVYWALCREMGVKPLPEFPNL